MPISKCCALVCSLILVATGVCQADDSVDREEILKRLQRTVTFFETTSTEVRSRWVSKHITREDFPEEGASLAAARELGGNFWIDQSQTLVVGDGFQYYEAQTFDQTGLQAFDDRRTSGPVAITRAIWNGEHGKVLDESTIRNNPASGAVIATPPHELTMPAAPSIVYANPSRLGRFPQWESIVGNEHSDFEKLEADADGSERYHVSLDTIEVGGQPVPGARIEIWIGDNGESVTIERGTYIVPGKTESHFTCSDFQTLVFDGTEYLYPARIEVEYLTFRLRQYAHEVNFIESLQVRPEADVSDYDFAFPVGTVVTNRVAGMHYHVGAETSTFRLLAPKPSSEAIGF